jgi:hypothetical protein
MCTSIQIFKAITLKISQANTPMIHQVTPIIDYVCTELDKVINDSVWLLVIRHAFFPCLIIQCVDYHMRAVLHPNKGKKRVFDEIDDWEGTYTAVNDELESYLLSSRIQNADDPIIYWQSQAHAGLASEAFARMAIDHLSCPGKSIMPSTHG